VAASKKFNLVQKDALVSHWHKALEVDEDQVQK
jgi:hypothetical protein